VEDEKMILKSLVTVKKEKARVFQVLLLDNNEGDYVEVQESRDVDFARVEEHLAHGGSVFITSKNSQKIALPKAKPRRNRTRNVTAFSFN
jgi:hypothetical protein